MRYKNEGKKKENGVVYTPSEMASYLSKQMLKYLKNNSDELSIIDPSVGKGNLLIELLKNINLSEKKVSVVGYETDPYIARFAQERIKLLFPSISIEIRNKNFLSVVSENVIEKFDLVIANPPYIRTQILGTEKAQELAKKFFLDGRIDLYYVFLLHTKNILKNDGVAGFITSNKFLTIKSGLSVRNFMLDNFIVHHIIDFGDTKIFDASVLPCIIIFSPGKTVDNNKVSFTSIYQIKENSKSLSVISINNIFDAIDSDGYYTISDGRTFNFSQGVIKNVNKNSLWTIVSRKNEDWSKMVSKKTYMTFSQLGKIHVGIKTTADNVFIKENWENDYADLELLKPLITHRNSGQIISANKHFWKVLYTHTMLNGKKIAYNLDDYPKTKSYLEQHYEQLSKREYLVKANRNWYEIWVPQNPDSWRHKKIVFRDISEQPEFWFDSSGAIINGDCYWIEIHERISDDLIFLALAIANSSFIEKFYDINFNTKLYSGKRRYQAQYVEKFPIPFYNTDEAIQAISIVKKIIADDCLEAVASYKDVLNKLVDRMFS